MAILKIAKMGHPILLQKAKKVDDPTDPKIKTLVNDMLETLDDLGNGVGLAAPQVHVSLQVVIFETASNDGKEANLITLINPKIDVLTKETSIDWEGCLSVPGLRGQVIRPNKIKYSGLDLKGDKIETIAEGFNFPLRHFMSKNFSAPRSAPKPASVTTSVSYTHLTLPTKA